MMIGIPIGLAYSNLGEWLLHKHVLHGLGKKKDSFWSFHWHDHHRVSRQNDMVDPVYVGPWIGWTPKHKEVASLVGLAALHLPLLPVAPFFTATVLFSIGNYYRVHRKAHLDPGWAKEKLPWHVDHHLGKNQDANWCVTFPLFDWVLGTREPASAWQTPATARTTAQAAS